MILTKHTFDETATTVVTKQDLVDVKAPEWAEVLLGVWFGNTNVTPTADEGTELNFFMTSDDMPISQPQEFLAPSVSSIEAADGMQLAPMRQYYALNLPLNGGETIKTQSQVLASQTGITVAQAAYVFGQLSDAMPSYMDPHPGVARFHKIGTHTATADDLATGTAYTIVGGDFLRRVFGSIVVHTSDSDKPESGFYRFSSTGFASSPIEEMAEGIGSYAAGTTGSVMGPMKLTDRYQNMPITRYCIIQDYYYQLGGVAITTDYWQTGVEFSRQEAWYTPSG